MDAAEIAWHEQAARDGGLALVEFMRGLFEFEDEDLPVLKRVAKPPNWKVQNAVGHLSPASDVRARRAYHLDAEVRACLFEQTTLLYTRGSVYSNELQEILVSTCVLDTSAFTPDGRLSHASVTKIHADAFMYHSRARWVIETIVDVLCAFLVHGITFMVPSLASLSRLTELLMWCLGDAQMGWYVAKGFKHTPRSGKNRAEQERETASFTDEDWAARREVFRGLRVIEGLWPFTTCSGLELYKSGRGTASLVHGAKVPLTYAF